MTRAKVLTHPWDSYAFKSESLVWSIEFLLMIVLQGWWRITFLSNMSFCMRGLNGHLKQFLNCQLTFSQTTRLFKVSGARLLFIYSIHRCPVSDTGRDQIELLLGTVRRPDSSSSVGPVSSDSQKMAEMLGAISYRFPRDAGLRSSRLW